MVPLFCVKGYFAACGHIQWLVPFAQTHRMPAGQFPRCMFGNLGADYLVGEPVPSTEQSGSDKLGTLFLRASRRTGLPTKQRNSLGSGPAGPENFGYFPSLESSPPAGGISPKKRNRGFAAAAASFFLSDQKETKESPGVSFVRKALRLRLALSLTIPPVPRFTGEPEGCAGSCGRRGDIIKGVYAYSLPFCSVDESGASTRCNAPKWCSIHRGR